MKWPQSEVELAKPVVEWLADLHWDVYQEVQIYGNGAVADIVAVQNKIVWVLECKRSFTLDLIGQAAGWLPFANFVSVVVPYGRRLRSWEIALIICKQLGIGIMQARPLDSGRIAEHLSPHLNRRVSRQCVLDKLRPEHKSFAPAGNANGKRWTPFQATCSEIARAVHAKPGIRLKDLIDGVRTHYASTSTARACIAKWSERGIIKGVRIERDGRFLTFYPADAKIGQ